MYVPIAHITRAQQWVKHIVLYFYAVLINCGRIFLSKTIIKLIIKTPAATVLIAPEGTHILSFCP